MPRGAGAITLAGKTPPEVDSASVQFCQSCDIHFFSESGVPQPVRIQDRTAVAAALGGSFDHLFRDEHHVRFGHHRDDRAPESHIGVERVLPLVISLFPVGCADCGRREHH